MTPFDLPKDILTVAGTIAAAIIGVALVAVIVGKNAQTASTIGAASGGLASVIGAAVAPVSSGAAGTTPTSPLGDLGSPIANNATGITANGSGLFGNMAGAGNSFGMPNTSLFSPTPGEGYYQNTGSSLI